MLSILSLWLDHCIIACIELSTAVSVLEGVSQWMVVFKLNPFMDGYHPNHFHLLILLSPSDIGEIAPHQHHHTQRQGRKKRELEGETKSVGGPCKWKDRDFYHRDGDVNMTLSRRLLGYRKSECGRTEDIGLGLGWAESV
ncbi:hypothetical protein R1flu_012524 [Riccia fluitans]|uniref:Uncharacterized protein n=1 Tax=Riccia fluitans TaxID=41844 RepID=A0ABD1ZAV1_9MARC